jgi:hypothetical protein
MSEETLYCVNHPKTPTGLRCNKCGNPICSKCAVRTPVGYSCKECIRNQQAVFYTSTGFDYVIAAVVGLLGGVIGAVIAQGVGLFFAFFLSPLAGGLTAEAVRFAVRRRRGRYTWLVVGAAIAVATLAVALFPLLLYLSMLPVMQSYEYPGASPFAMSGFFFRLELLLYAVLAIGAAAARLR